MERGGGDVGGQKETERERDVHTNTYIIYVYMYKERRRANTHRRHGLVEGGAAELPPAQGAVVAHEDVEGHDVGPGLLGGTGVGVAAVAAVGGWVCGWMGVCLGGYICE